MKHLNNREKVKVYRDNNRDGKYDLNEANIHEGIYGINIHRKNKVGRKKIYTN